MQKLLIGSLKRGTLKVQIGTSFLSQATARIGALGYLPCLTEEVPCQEV